MEEKIVEYGTRRTVTVERSDAMVIICYDKSIKEAFILVYHGVVPWPRPGEEGEIVFERDNRRGHWQYYRKTKQKL